MGRRSSRYPLKLFRLFIISAFLFSNVLSSFAYTAKKTGSKKAAYNFKPARIPMLSITLKESQFHVDMLASDEFQGRETGTPGQWLAAKYIANEFSNYGLSPTGNDPTYYQNFQIIQKDLKSATLWIAKNSGGLQDKVEFSLKTNFVPFSFTGENNLTTKIVFAGYGITAPEYDYDDYKNIDVSGKIVLVLRHEPQENDLDSIFDGSRPTKYSLFEVKAQNALNHGAVAMLLVTDPQGMHGTMGPQGFWPAFYKNSSTPKRWHLETKTQNDEFPAFWIGGSVAHTILRDTGYSLDDLQIAIDKTLKPKSLLIENLDVHIGIELKKNVRKTQNVLGLLEGSDPALRDEVVVIGAHYDHIGIVDGKIHNGADDNASGTAGLLEIAEAFSEMPFKPSRSILFMAFSAEEFGLLGSKYYVSNPIIPLNRVVAMINLDMISRNNANDVTVIGTNRSRELHELNLAANEEIGLNISFNGEKYFNRSDQANFAKHKIPVIFYNTDVHSDYHRPTDTSDKINPEKLARISRLAFLVAWNVASSDFKPTYKRFIIRNYNSF